MAEAAAVGMGLSLLGTIGSTAANVRAANVNAKALEAEARSKEAQAAFDETQLRRQSKFAMGDANAVTAASGVDISRGSPLLMELDRAKQSEIAALSVRRGGQIAAASDRFAAGMQRRAVPGMILGGVAQGGSILSQYVGRPYTYGSMR